MRILYFSRAYTVHDRRFLAQLAASPHEIWHQQLENDSSPYELRPPPDGIRGLPPLYEGEPLASPDQWIRLAPRFETVLAQVQPHLVHAGPIQTCAFLTAITGFHPLIAMSWGSDILVDAARDEFWGWMTRFTLQRCDRLIADCTEVSEAAVRIGLDRRRIVQFPWGVDLQAFRPGADPLALRDRPGWKDAVIVIGTRSWEPNYGVLDLLEGFQQARTELPRLRLLLVGSGSQRPAVEGWIREHRLEDAVCLAGAVPAERLPEHFRAADIYASCAFSDGSSVSLLEAMATGLPVLATDRASNREWIADSQQGRLVPFGNVPAIARALVELARLSAEQRREMALRNRAAVEARADWKRNAGRLLEAYGRLLSAAR